MLIPIVGIRHYIDNTETFLRSLTPETLVQLSLEDSNSKDRTAIAAWIDGQKVGYVSSDYTLLIRTNYPDSDSFRTHVCVNDWALEDKAFYVEVPLTTFEFSLDQLALPLASFHDIPLPRVLTPRRLLAQHLFDLCDELSPYMEETQPVPEAIQALFDVAQRFSTFFGSGLSFDDRHLYLRITDLLMEALNQEPDAQQAELLYREYLILEDTRRHFAADSSLAAAVMESELRAIRPELSSLLEECDALVRCGLATRAQLIRENDEWLRALPNHLYAYLTQPEELAPRLFYMRLSTEELYAIYIHLLLRREWQPARAHGKKYHPGFQYWEKGLGDDDRKAAVRQMRDAVASSPKQPTAKLALCIKHLQTKNIIRRDISPISEFTAQLNLLLGTEIKPNSLSKFFTRHA